MTTVKMFDPFARRPGSSMQAFSDHWTRVHAEIAKGLPQIAHYVQNHRLEDKPRALGPPLADPPYDGSSETWYSGLDSLQSMIEHPVVEDMLRDEANFLDHQERRFPLLVEERVVAESAFDESDRGIKVLLFVRRPRGVTLEDFRAGWVGDDDADLGNALGATRHAVGLAISESYGLVHPTEGLRDRTGDLHAAEEPYDGVRLLWWHRGQDIQRARERAPHAWARLITSPAIDAPRSFALFAREVVILP